MRFLGMTGLALVAGFGLSAAVASATQAPSPPTVAGAATASATATDDRANLELMDHHRHHYERAALVDKVEAHWEFWRQVNHGEQPGEPEHGGRLAKLAEDVSLTPDQVSSISTAYHAALAGLRGDFDPQRGEAHVHAFSTTFAASSFDAKSVTSNANGHLAGYGAARMALFYETVTPLLTPEQRTKLAEQLRTRGSDPSATSRT